jgi:hypothetical protein
MPQYISASRRCDLPRFVYQQFFDAWRKGEITYDGGWGRSYSVSLRPEDVCGYIFWSKDFSAFIEQADFRELIAITNAVFHFTINDNPDLESRIPPIERRLDTLRELCDRVGPERVFWRFDPISKYVNEMEAPVLTDRVFYVLLPRIARMGVTRCFFSFMTDYAKLRTRPVQFKEIETERRVAIASEMLAAARQEGVHLFNCCNMEIPELVPGIQTAHCVDEDSLRETDRFGMHRPSSPRPTRKGCGCCESRDIGSYSPPCPHGCLYCYANPRISEISSDVEI